MSIPSSQFIPPLPYSLVTISLFPLSVTLSFSISLYVDCLYLCVLYLFCK